MRDVGRCIYLGEVEVEEGRFGGVLGMGGGRDVI